MNRAQPLRPEQFVSMYCRQARKYKAMRLPVQRRTAVEYALYWRRLRGVL